MADLNDMTLEKFKLWSPHALRVFLSLRKKKIHGNFDEISARAFCTWEENIPVDSSAEQAELRLLAEYKQKLVVGDEIIPDPLSLKDGWIGEKTAVTKWPSIYITDIASYLNSQTPKEIVHRLMNEYKEGKAYRYFSCEWVKEISFHPISSNSPVCILKSRVTPSQAVNNKAYSVWIVVRKDSEPVLGGEIVTGYCSCTAGMLGCCNHIAGVLFRIEHAVKTGITKPTCTSKQCEWNIPSKVKTTIKPLKVSEAVWRKSHYTNINNVAEEKQKKEKKMCFTPLTKKQSNSVKDESKIRSNLYRLLRDDIPDSCFSLMMEKRRHKVKKVECPPSLLQVAANLERVSSTDEVLKNEFIKQICLSEKEAEALQTSTIDQAQCDTWKEQRKGRITASNFHRVCSRVNTLRKDENSNPDNLIKTLMGYTNVVKTKSMKHGISLEPHAKKAYTHSLKKKHQRFKSKDAGLAVHKSKAFIAVSADLDIECQCCGYGLCEIKCPETLKDQIPSVDNVSYICSENDVLCVRQSHPYYYQMQGQMGVMQRSYCDLFIFTFHGHITVRVMFDKDFWETALEKMSWFWDTYMIKEIINPILYSEKPCSTGTLKEAVSDKASTGNTNTNKQSTTASLLHLHEAKVTDGNEITEHNSFNKRRCDLSRKPVFLCGSCGVECTENQIMNTNESVTCDICRK